MIKEKQSSGVLSFEELQLLVLSFLLCEVEWMVISLTELLGGLDEIAGT